MFRFFEGLVDPYVTYDTSDAPPRRLWPFIREYSRPFARVFAVAGVVSVLAAAMEVWLIGYTGRVVDLLADADPKTVLREHGLELGLVAAFILLVRPVVHGLGVLLLNNAIVPNYGTLWRWRAHRHVLRQSVGWFESDFAGRIANRISQTPPAAGEVIYQTFDAITYALAYLVGAMVLLSDADPRLAIPMLIWLVLYFGLMRWTLRRVGPASLETCVAGARAMAPRRREHPYFPDE